jgi:hypothetical protein
VITFKGSSGLNDVRERSTLEQEVIKQMRAVLALQSSQWASQLLGKGEGILNF